MGLTTQQISSTSGSRSISTTINADQSSWEGGGTNLHRHPYTKKHLASFNKQPYKKIVSTTFFDAIFTVVPMGLSTLQGSSTCDSRFTSSTINADHSSWDNGGNLNGGANLHRHPYTKYHIASFNKDPGSPTSQPNQKINRWS
jgi:hypothetical protein